MKSTARRNSALLIDFLEQSGLCKRQLKPIAQRILAIVESAIEDNTYPKWGDRFKHENLRNLNATEFLLAVHGDLVRDNTVVKSQIRSLDPELMTVIESYIANRIKRGHDLGHAKGLKFVSRFRPVHLRLKQSEILYNEPKP